MQAAPLARDPRMAAWLVARRRQIEGALAARLGESAPGPASPETEALRRFRSFAAQALQRGAAPAPALDGVRVPERRVAEILDAWIEAAATAAGPRSEAVRGALSPLGDAFRAALRDTAPARRKSGAPRTGSRAVRAAIDRVADGYLAIDVDARTIVDANPAAGALLATPRDALLGRAAAAHVPAEECDTWWAHLDALAEGGDTRRFRTRLRAAGGSTVELEVSLTRYAQRHRILGLAVLRPQGSPATPAHP